jgi:glycosyltransferase involved in cell wall biosynthesis
MQVKNPKIIMLLLEFHPIFTGHGIYLQQLSNYLNKCGCDISILAADFHSLPSHEIVNDLNVYRFPFSHNEKFWELKLALRVINFLFRNRNSYDILHIHGHLDIYGLLTLFNVLLRKHTISQMVLLGADDPMTLMGTYRFMRLRYKVLTLMDRFLCISKVLGESYQHAGLPMGKLTYIPQGVDVERFAPVVSIDEKETLKKNLGLSDFNEIVIFVGAIVERKGVDWLIDAWRQVQKRHPDALLLLVGQDVFDGNDVNEDRLNSFVDAIRKIISENQLNVHFAGKQLDVDRYFHCADVFVLPSRKEGFGNVILEGMASGLPVVVTYMDGVSLETVVHGKNGFIVNSVSELSHSLTTLLSDKALSHSMGKAGRKMAVEAFSMSNIADRYAGVYREITGEPM